MILTPAISVLTCTLIGWLCGSAVAGLAAGLVLLAGTVWLGHD